MIRPHDRHENQRKEGIMAKQTTPTVTFKSQAFELLRSHMDDEGRLTIPVRLSLECVRTM
jgi:hypothetical protein